ncbi:MAG: thioesterase family protein [Rhodobacteraceae bacterium]|nr:thioesterase family protein [Paracoccaceae bacterium]
MTDLSLKAVLDTAMTSEEGITFSVSDNWKQGRTAFGGFTAALLLSAARSLVDGLPPLRSALINFTAPVSSPPTLSGRLLRRGRNVTTVQVDAHCEGKLAATAVFSFGVAQDSHVVESLPAPAAIAPEKAEPFVPEGVVLPVNFLRNFEVRLIDGHRPFSGAETGYVRVWARHKDPEIHDHPEALMSIADLLPPAVFSMARKPGPNSSMNWICNFLSEDLTTKNGWWMLESRLTMAQDGYSSQVMRAWNAKGELVVDGMQSVVIFV